MDAPLYCFVQDSDLRSALLLEQAAHCFINMRNPMVRKFAFHMILAGHRFSKAGQVRLSADTDLLCRLNVFNSTVQTPVLCLDQAFLLAIVLETFTLLICLALYFVTVT